MLYNVKYKHNNKWFWNILKKVKGDIVDQSMGVRVFFLDDETRIEIPLNNTVFIFSSERFICIKQNMEKQAGQVLPVNKAQ